GVTLFCCTTYPRSKFIRQGLGYPTAIGAQHGNHPLVSETDLFRRGGPTDGEQFVRIGRPFHTGQEPFNLNKVMYEHFTGRSWVYRVLKFVRPRRLEQSCITTVRHATQTPY